MRLTAIRNGPKQTISSSDGLDLLQMVSEPDTTSEDARPPRGVNCEIPHRLEKGTKHSLQGCRKLSIVDAF